MEWKAKVGIAKDHDVENGVCALCNLVNGGGLLERKFSTLAEACSTIYQEVSGITLLQIADLYRPKEPESLSNLVGNPEEWAKFFG